MKITKREAFNREREFLVHRPMLIGGKPLARGQPFDKTRVTVRRLRQLYDNHDINHRPEEPRPATLLADDVETFRKEHTNGQDKTHQEVQEVHSLDFQEAQNQKTPQIERVKPKIERVRRKSDHLDP